MLATMSLRCDVDFHGDGVGGPRGCSTCAREQRANCGHVGGILGYVRGFEDPGPVQTHAWHPYGEPGSIE